MIRKAGAKAPAYLVTFYKKYGKRWEDGLAVETIKIFVDVPGENVL